MGGGDMTGFVQKIRAAAKGRLRAGALALAGLLAACSHTDIGPTFTEDVHRLDPATFECCFDPEKFYPAPAIELALGLANSLGPAVSRGAYGQYEDTAYPGKLTGKTEAHAAIVADLKPLDLLLIGNTSYPLGRLVPGRFSHTLVYLGTEAQLRAAGLWNLPEVKPYHEAIRAGQIIAETAAPATRLRTPAKAFEADRVLALRPALSPEERVLAARRLFASVGVPINYTLGIKDAEGRFSCTGLAEYAMPGLGLRHRVVYGQEVIMPDDIAAQAIRGERLRVVSYTVGTDSGFERHSVFALMVHIAAFWGVPGAR
ncbi:MAG: hypothetical protein D6801_07965 [Alphaproteobacteria bacterium]|nr:MAG: hypothetical protein D6801_07965 [Alphaproteobacteria bacterium]